MIRRHSVRPASGVASAQYNVGAADKILERFREGTQDIRLITILSAEGEAAASSQIQCRLDLVSLDDQYHSPAYRKYLERTNAYEETGEFLKVAAASQECKQQGLEDWIEVSAPKDDATTSLPEFRYTWGDYLALSYTWGDPSITREILLNGYTMRVTANVEACLRVLRDKAYIKKGWKIWVDALCINQADIVERASQVKRMQQIYSKAWTPIIWLGDLAEGSDGAMALIRKLADTYTMHDPVNVLTQALHRDPELFGKGRWRSVYQLATRRYWSRLWILQEAALGRKNTPVLCGQQTIRWIDVSRAFGLLENTDEVINKFMVNELKAAGLDFSLSIWMTFSTVSGIQVLQDVQVGHQQANLHRSLALQRTVFAFDPRDKIYGFLNLLDPSITALLTPDYTASVLDVYTDFAQATIRATGSLDIIRHSCPTPNQEFPSWVPDWTVEPNYVALTVSTTTFATSGSSTTTPRYLSGNKHLSCKGFRVDRFDGMGCEWGKGWSLESVIPTTGSANPYGTIDAVREAIWKTMVACRDTYGEPLRDDYSGLLATPMLHKAQYHDNNHIRELIHSNIFDWCVRFLKGNAPMRVCGREFSAYFTDARSPGEVDPVHLRDALMQRDRINLARRLVTTKRGYVGMALETTQKEDVICVLLGCTMPVVLRPVGDRFRVVGECYIHGLMQGEAMEWLETGECQLEEIVLC